MFQSFIFQSLSNRVTQTLINKNMNTTKWTTSFDELCVVNSRTLKSGKYSKTLQTISESYLYKMNSFAKSIAGIFRSPKQTSLGYSRLGFSKQTGIFQNKRSPKQTSPNMFGSQLLPLLLLVTMTTVQARTPTGNIDIAFVT